MEHYDNTAIYEKIHAAQAGDKAALEALVSHHFKLVYAVSKRFIGRGLEAEDLNQLGAIGLLKAIMRFDATKNLCFSTYAVPLILGEIRCFLRDNGPIKVSRSLKQIAYDAARAEEEIQKNEGRTPGVLELAKRLHVQPEELTKAKEATAPPKSLFAHVGDSETPLCDTIPAKEQETGFLERLDLKDALKTLPTREQTLIFMRYFDNKSQTEVAKKLGISQVQVSRIEKKILNSVKMQLKCQL